MGDVSVEKLRRWKERRYEGLCMERREAVAEGDDLSAANAVGGMLELLELESWLISQGQSQ